MAFSLFYNRFHLRSYQNEGPDLVGGVSGGQTPPTGLHEDDAGALERDARTQLSEFAVWDRDDAVDQSPNSPPSEVPAKFAKATSNQKLWTKLDATYTRNRPNQLESYETEMTESLTSADAARLLGVGPSTIKRWADEGKIQSLKTPGGHRRFARREVERFREAHGSQSEDDVFRLLQLILHAGSTYELQSSLVGMRGRLGSWWRVSDVVAASLKELGELWQQGSCSIAQEHHATRHLQQAIWACGEALPSPPPAPRCILAAVEREEHTLGLSLGEMCLREAGWACLWLGSPTPTSVLLEAIQQFTPNLVVASASSFATDSDFLEKQCRSICEQARRCGAPLILAGDGAWPDDCGKRIRSFEEFAGVLAR